MTYAEFDATARRMWGEIPDEYKEGIDALVVRREAKAHAEEEDYFTMGTCVTEPYPSGYGDSESTRSILAVYYGSFRKVAGGDPDFDWEDELWETITHELRHHLEFLAEDDALERVDYAMEQEHRRAEGLDFDPWYYQSGTPVAPGVYRLEKDVYIEQLWRPETFEARESLEFEWDRRRWRIPRPERLGDLHYVWVEDVDLGGGSLQLVLVRRLSMWQRATRLRRRTPLDLLESASRARPVESGPGEAGAASSSAGGPS